MSIAALPESTVRLLGSHTVIATPVDLVKELLDNAIDAKATSVDILASSNIVDKVEVRDNGQGIYPADYDSLGRAGHTSKITSFEDLRTLGGTTLGFRGQALASINNLGTVTVTTRTAEETVGTELALSRDTGGVKSQRKASAPVGTTVSVAGLYNHLPVRKQTATKDALKSLVKVKQLLHAYALARPHIRLSFRTTGGGNRQTFSYSPRPEAGVKEAIVQIFGIELASQCLINTVCTRPNNESDEITEGNQKFIIEAVLPRKDADQSRIAKGSFFSVDSRPVSAQRGTMKKLLAIFKTYQSAYLQTTYGEKAFRDPFICVNIRCSTGSYDPNIEPSKNVVLFVDDSQLTELFKRLCTEMYCRTESHDPFVVIGKRQLLKGPQIGTPPKSSDSPRYEETTAVTIEEVPQNLVAPSKTPIPNNSSPNCELAGRSKALRKPAPAIAASKEFAFDMSADPDMSSDEEAEVIAAHFRQHDQEHQTEEGDEDPRQALNPWTIAKMNAPAQPINNIAISNTGQPQDSSPPQEQSDLTVQSNLFENSPVLRTFGAVPADLDAILPARLAVTHTSLQQKKLSGFRGPFEADNVLNAVSHNIAQPALHVDKANSMHSPPTPRDSTIMLSVANLQNPESRMLGANSRVQTSLDIGRRSESLKTSKKSRVQRHINDIRSKTNPPFRKPKRVNDRNRHPSIFNQGHIDRHVVDWIDKNHLTNEALDPLSRQGTLRLTTPPRSCSDMTGSDSNQPSLSSVAPPGNESWKDGDTRRYLMKRQRSEAEHRKRGRQPLKRVKTDRLPLETVPQCQDMQRLVLSVHIDALKLANVVRFMARLNGDLDDSGPETKSNEEMNLDDVVEIEARFKNLLDDWTEKVLGEKREVSLNLRSQVKGKMVAG